MGVKIGHLVVLLGKKGLEQGTGNVEEIKQDSAERGSSVVICKKYLSKEHSPLKPGREPEFPILRCRRISVRPEGSVSHLAVVQGLLFNYPMLSSGDRSVPGISLGDEPVWFFPTLPYLPL